MIQLNSVLFAKTLVRTETFINMLQVRSLHYFFNLNVFSSFVQGFVSLRRIEKYLNGAEVNAVPPLDQQSKTVAFQSCTLTWPQDCNASSLSSSTASSPKHKFVLVDLSLNFPQGELSLVCGKLRSRKTLLLLGKLFSLFRSSHDSNPVLSI
jgi:ABC-type multidrug transport system fused ATPase/permease subunit